MYHNSDVFGVKRPLEFSVIGSVLEDDSFAEEAGGWSTEDVFSLFESLGIVKFISNDDSDACLEKKFTL